MNGFNYNQKTPLVDLRSYLKVEIKHRLLQQYAVFAKLKKADN
jgi:hypothetical protein